MVYQQFQHLHQFEHPHSILFRTHILPDRLSKILQLPLHLLKLTINVQQWSSFGFKSIRLSLAMHGSSCIDIHFVVNDPLKFSSTIKSC